ncbi:MAG: hypothetical protein ACTHKY_14550 [Ginsengibacter sp.]
MLKPYITYFVILITVLVIYNMFGTKTMRHSLKLNGGTTVVAFLKDDTGWIAADSKVVEETNGAITGSHTVKKIKQTDDIFYAFTVHPQMYFDNELIYDAFSIMESTIKSQKDFDKSFNAFDSLITVKLDKAIKILLEHKHIAMLEKYTKTSFLGFLMVQYKNSKPSYKISSYKFEKVGDGYKTVPDPPLVMQGAYPLLFLGSYEAALRYIRSHPKFLVGFKNVRQKLICLVSEEISANPEYVGFPIDAVEITKDGSQWYNHIMECSLKE